MSEGPAPNRRWFRFSLWTLFVVISGVATVFGWASNWATDRQAFLQSQSEACRPTLVGYGGVAPMLLRIVGEPGITVLSVGFDGKLGASLNPEQLEELERIRRLFPEAKVDGYIYREVL